MRIGRSTGSDPGGRRPPKQAALTLCFGAAFAVMSVALIAAVFNVKSAIGREDAARARQTAFMQLSQQMADAADFLALQVRIFAVTGDRRNLDAYWHEVNGIQTQQRVIERLRALGADPDLLEPLSDAKYDSELLMATEIRSMRLALEADGVDRDAMPPQVAAYRLSAMDQALDAEEKASTAARVLFDPTYMHKKENFSRLINQFRDDLNASATREVDAARKDTAVSVTVLAVLAVFISFGMAVVLWCMHGLVGRAIVSYARRLAGRDPQDLTFALDPAGTRELHQLAAAFNDQFGQLRTVAERDPLTGLYNRRGFRSVGEDIRRDAVRTGVSFTALFVDIDQMKRINDDLGHAAGDAAIVAAARLLNGAVRDGDPVARLGGDEFCALLTGVTDPTTVAGRIEALLVDYNMAEEPKLSLSVGFARFDPATPCSLDELLSQGDVAMYSQKRNRARSRPHSGAEDADQHRDPSHIS
ncbi:diguanylate cyclase [Krasilnikovia sp. MM14-A1004]|uniref:GGDEF domain-containing protein n=1 Tax=Krasilnikovia sp. MM14-A1004 TaxID=3373541 RepID=UPI00399CA80C